MSLRFVLDVSVQDDFSFLIQYAEIHSLGVKIDAAVKFVLLGVKSHLRPPLGKDLGSRIIPVSGMVQGGLNEYRPKSAARGTAIAKIKEQLFRVRWIYLLSSVHVFDY